MKSYAFENKTILITGASSGIGKAFVQALAKHNNTLILLARREKILTHLKEELEQKCKIHIMPHDLNEPDQIEQLPEKLNRFNLKPEVIIHCAGISQRSLAKELHPNASAKLWQVNYFSPVTITRKLLPLVKEHKRAKIIVISSIAGLFGYPLRSTYSACKHALKGYFESLSLEEERNGVEVHLVYPGRINTEISFHALAASGKAHQKYDQGQREGMSPSKCVRIVLRNIGKGKRSFRVGKSELYMYWIYRIFPNWYRRLAIKLELDA